MLQNLFAALSSFYVVQFYFVLLSREDDLAFCKTALRVVGDVRAMRAMLKMIFRFCLVVVDIFLMLWAFFCRCGSKIAEPSGGRESVLARCNRSGHTSPLLMSCLFLLGLRTMHRYQSHKWL